MALAAKHLERVRAAWDPSDWTDFSEAWVRNLLQHAPSNDAIAAIIVMGSAIRDRGHRRSDVDLLVLFQGKRPRLRPPVEVDIRYHPMEEVESLAKSGNEVVTWALKFGHPLYDPEQRWASLRADLAPQLQLPSEDEARVRAERSLRVCREMLAIGDEDAADDLILAVLTQLVRAELIHRGIFPASRPELPTQLKMADPENELANLLEDAMYSNRTASDLYATSPRCVPLPDASLRLTRRGKRDETSMFAFTTSLTLVARAEKGAPEARASMLHDARPHWLGQIRVRELGGLEAMAARFVERAAIRRVRLRVLVISPSCEILGVRSLA